MVAVPAPLVVQGHQEQVSLFQLGQDRLAVVDPDHGIAQGSGQALEDGGLEQEGLEVGRLLLEHLFDQVIEDEAMAAGEGLDKAGQAGGAMRPPAALHGDGHHLQAGDPAFGASIERSYVLGREVEVHDVVQEGRRFLGGETEVLGTQLGHLTPSTQPGQGPGRIGTAGQDQVQLRGQVLQQKGEPIVDLPLGDQVQVVEDEDEGGWTGGCDVVEQAGQGCLKRGRGGCAGSGGKPGGRSWARAASPTPAARSSGMVWRAAMK